MTWRGSRWAGFRRVFRLPASPARVTREVDEELRFHIEGRVEQLVAAGWPRSDAETEARRRFGDYAAYRREARDIDLVTHQQRRRMDIVDVVRREVRQSVRALVRTPAFSLVALATLVLGIGATAAIFTVLDAVVLRPLPYPHPSGSCRSRIRFGKCGHRGKWGVSPAGYFSFSVSALARDGGIYSHRHALRLVRRDRAGPVAQITSSLFSVLGARPPRVACSSPDDDVADRPRRRSRIRILATWLRRRPRSSDARSTSRETVPVVGVAAPDVSLPMPSRSPRRRTLPDSAWTYGSRCSSIRPRRPVIRIPIDAREARPGELMPMRSETRGAHLASAGDRSLGVFAAFMKQYHFSMAVTSLQTAVVGATARVLWVVFGAVALVLLMAAANVANLFLVRLEAHRREAAVRSALGRRRGHLVAHYLAESLLLTLTAGAMATLLAWGALHVFIAAAPPNISRLASVALGWRTVGFTAALSVALGVTFGLVPMMARRDVDTATLREGGRGLTSSRATRLVRDALIVGQMSLALVLLAAAGLMLRTMGQLRHVKPGFDPRNAITMHVHAPWSRYAGWAPVAALQRSLRSESRRCLECELLVPAPSFRS